MRPHLPWRPTCHSVGINSRVLEESWVGAFDSKVPEIDIADPIGPNALDAWQEVKSVFVKLD